jgi:hypothetical protein
MAALSRRLQGPLLRRVALILASDMASADGALHPREHAMLHDLAAAFDMTSAEAEAVLGGLGDAVR